MALVPPSNRSSGGGGAAFSSGSGLVIHTGMSPEFPFTPIAQLITSLNGIWDVASKPWATPMRLASAITVVKLGFKNGGGVTTNMDVGIYDTSWNRLISTGSVARSVVGGWQWVAVTSTPLAAGDYFLAGCCDSAAGSQAAPFGLLSAAHLQMYGCQDSATSAFPLPNPLTNMALATTFTQVHQLGVAKTGAPV